jgi:hypothetical protein
MSMHDEQILAKYSKPSLWSLIKENATKIQVNNIGLAENYTQARAEIYHRWVELIPARGKITAAVNMHELGHIAVTTPEKRIQMKAAIAIGNKPEIARLNLIEERAAWSWAKWNMPFYDDEIKKFALLAINSRQDVIFGNMCADIIREELKELLEK